MRDKVDKLLRTIDELQSSESSTQLSARRAERELREEKEKSLRLERELEGWKGLRADKFATGSAMGSVRSRTGAWSGMNVSIGDDAASAVEVPARKSSIGRAPSMTKGFL